MSEFDSFQLREFREHWSDSFVEVDGRPLYVREVDPNNGIFRGVDVITDISNNYPCSKVKPLYIRPGFYPINNDGSDAGIFTRIPTRHTKRGLNSRNAGFLMRTSFSQGAIKASDPSLDISTVRHLFEIDRNINVKSRDWARVCKVLSSGGIHSYPIGRNYCFYSVRLQEATGFKVLLCGINGPIGKILRYGIKLHPKASYFYESVKEEVEKTFGKEKVEINA